MDYKKYYQYTLNEIELLKKNYKYNINQEKISKILIKYPKILRYQDENGNNLGMVACQVKLSRIIFASLCDPVASNQVNVYGEILLQKDEKYINKKKEIARISFLVLL